MNLYLFPEAANKNDGYGIGVDFAYNKLQPKDDDVIVWRSTYPKENMLHYKESDYLLGRNKHLSIKTAINLIRKRPSIECSVKDLAFLSYLDFEMIHCDEVLFYRAIRKLYPQKKISIRFHNCFSRIWVRNLFLKQKIGLKYLINLKTFSDLEKEIFADPNVYKIFISDEDRDFYCSLYGVTSDSETWQYKPDMEKMKRSQTPINIGHKLAWFGGIESHKEGSVNWFINNVLPKVKKEIPDTEFHLWGKNTAKFNNPSIGVYGHGYFDGIGLPLTNSLYVNPDIIGGGIKLKLMTLMESGAPFISTPFGFEGYPKDLIDGKYCIVEEEGNWADRILSVLRNNANDE